METEILLEIHRSLGRVESRLDAQDQVLNELREGHQVLITLTASFDHHLEDDAKIAQAVADLVARPAQRRKAVTKWSAGIVASVLSALLILVLKGCAL